MSRLQYFCITDVSGVGVCLVAQHHNIENMQRATDFGRDGEAVSLDIGIIIRDELRRQGRSAIWLASKINCDRRNVYDIFSRSYIDTGLLFRISHILNFDFFSVLFRGFARFRRSISESKTLSPGVAEPCRGTVFFSFNCSVCV